MDIPDTEAQRISDQNRQLVAAKAQVAAFRLTGALHNDAIDKALVGGANGQGGDVAPIIQGLIGGIVEYLIRGGSSEETVRDIFEVSLRDLIPQVLLHQEAERLGATEEGRA